MHKYHMVNVRSLTTVTESFRRNPYQFTIYGFLIVLVAMPILVLAFLTIRYSVNVPWWDQLSFVDLMNKVHNGTLNFYDLWQQHNEHRLVFPQALELAVGWVTGYNFRVPVFLIFITGMG